MALSIGELVGYLRIDDSGVDDGLSRSERRIQGFSTGAKVAGAAAGAAVGAGLSQAMAGAIELDSANAKLEAQLGGAGPLSERAGEAAGALYANAYGSSMSEVNDAVKTVMQGIDGMNQASSDTLQNITGQAMSLSQTFDQDLGGTVNAVSQMMRTGLATSAEDAMDILAVGFQQGNDKAGDLLDTMNEYGTQFRKVGLDGATAMGLISQGLKAGARDADIVADAIKEFSIRAVDGSKSAAESYAALGLNAEEMTAKMSRGGADAAAGLDTVLDRLRPLAGSADYATIAFGLFGTQSEDLGEALSALDPSSAADKLDDVTGAAARLDETIGVTAAAKITAMQRGYEQWSQSLIATEGPLGTFAAGVTAFGPAGLSMVGSLSMIGMAIGPLLVQMVAGGVSMAATAAGWVASFATMAAGAVVHVASLVGSLIVWAAQQVAQGAIALASMVATGAVYIAQWVMMAAGAMARAAIMAAAWLVAMGPVGWVIAAVVGLVALIVANWDTVVAWTEQAWSAAGEVVSTVVQAIKDAVAAAVQWVLDRIAFLGQLPGMLGDFFGRAKDAALQKATELLIWVSGLPGRILSAIGNLGSLLLNAGRDIVTGLWNGILSMGSWLWNQIMGWIRSVVPGPILSFLGIASPSRWAHDKVGEMIPEGLAGGILDNARVAGDAARELAADTAAGARAGATGVLARIDTGTLGSGLTGRLTPRGGDGASAPTVSVTVNNPLPETTSDSINRRARTLAALGPF